MVENTRNSAMHQEKECVPLIIENHEPEANESENTSLLDAADSNSKKSLWKSTSTRQKLLLLDILFLEFIINGVEIISAPFFSRVVLQKGGTLFFSSLILEMVTATYTVASFLFGIYQQKIGLRRMFYFGLVASGVFQIAFGLLEFVDDIKVFVALGVIFKAICGIGVAGNMVAIYSAIVTEYPGHISQVIGLAITAVGCSRFIGPAYGGYMFDLYGMCIPLVIWGAVPIVTIPLHCLVYRVDDTNKTERYDLLSFLRKPSVIAMFLLPFMICGIYGYTDVALTIYFETVGLSVALVGLAMLTIGISLGLSGLIYGYLVGKKSWLAFVFIVVGAIGFSASLLIFSPCQLVPLIYVGCAILGVAGNGVLVPLFEELLIAANGGPITAQTNTALHSSISGVWNACIGAGMTLVPIVFSAIQTAAKTSVSTMFYAQSGLLFSITIFMIIAKKGEKKQCYICCTS